MKESEARKKWCPMIRVDGSNVTMDLTNGDIDFYPKYMASDCMMWVWDMDITFSELGPRINGRCKTEGHCGLTK